MTKFTIYIDGAKFTAVKAVIERVVSALEAAGYVYDGPTVGFVHKPILAAMEEKGK